MRTTYPEIKVNLVDVSAAEDAVYQTADNYEFGNLELLRQDTEVFPFACVEKNRTVLDGESAILSGSITNVAFWSSIVSGEDCLFTNNPKIQVSFAQKHTSVGIELHFIGDYPSRIKITWNTPEKRIEKEYDPDGLVFFCTNTVINYDAVQIEFVETRLPLQSVRLGYIKYGQNWIIKKEIKSASIMEEMDITGATLSINTAEVSFLDTENGFKMSDEQGRWKAVQKGQALSVTERIDGEPVECGTFYLETWEASSNIVKFKAVDKIGVIDKTTFYGGAIYSNEKAGVIIDAIMASCGVTDYSITEDVYNTELSGYLAIQSHRSALQQVIFAARATADCSRSNFIRIYQSDRYVSSTLELGRMFQGKKITLDEYVSTVAVSFDEYKLASEEEEICNTVLSPGKSMVQFSEPYLPSSVTISTGSIMEVSTNYVVVQMSERAECSISGRKYESVENTCRVSLQSVEAGEQASEKQYKGCTMMNAEQAHETAEYILKYLQLRQKVELRCIGNDERVGNWINVSDAGGKYATAGIISQTLDLSGGFVISMNCRGYATVDTAYDYAGEIYAGEREVM